MYRSISSVISWRDMGEWSAKNPMARRRDQPRAWMPVSTTSRPARRESAVSIPTRSQSSAYRPISSERRSLYRPHPSPKAGR